MTKTLNLHRASFPKVFSSAILLAAFVTLAACSTVDTFDGTPVSPSESGKHLPGKFVWHDLMTEDVSAAKIFYGALFDWTFEERPRYSVIKHGNQRIGGLVEVQSRTGESRTARWIASLSVQDVDQASKILLEAGGVIHEGPSEMKNRGRVAFVSDPHGAQLVLIRSKNGDPEDSPANPGGWLWNELWTDDPEDSINFYKNLAGYNSTDEIDSYVVLKANGKWRAGVRSEFDKGLEQRWVPVIRVQNAEDVSKAAQSLGGRVIVAVDKSDDDEATALLADPGGALFMVQEWQGIEQLLERGAK